MKLRIWLITLSAESPPAFISNSEKKIKLAKRKRFPLLQISAKTITIEAIYQWIAIIANDPSDLQKNCKTQSNYYEKTQSEHFDY